MQIIVSMAHGHRRASINTVLRTVQYFVGVVVLGLGPFSREKITPRFELLPLFEGYPPKLLSAPNQEHLEIS